jgi:hypothetical protein
VHTINNIEKNILNLFFTKIPLKTNSSNNGGMKTKRIINENKDCDLPLINSNLYKLGISIKYWHNKNWQ